MSGNRHLSSSSTTRKAPAANISLPSGPSRWAGRSRRSTSSMTTSVCPAPAATSAAASSVWWRRSAWARSASSLSPRYRGCHGATVSRCNSDWHRVIELCAVFATLIADGDGVYDPRDPNDRLLLGVKGTLFAAELHILQARMRGGLINKAQRGALAVTLPIGFRRTAKDGVMLDPDEAVRLAIASVFERFGVLRNARAVQRHFLTNGLKLPRLIQSGPETGQIVWVRPSYQMLHRMLVNPAYAGTFVYGRTKREVTPGDPPAIVDRRLAPEAWDIVVPDVYPAYLSFDAYLANCRQLADNRYNFAQKRRGAPREGSALLAGLIRCGRCGRQMGVGYGHGAPRYHCRGAQNAYGEPQCQSVAVRDIDQAVSSAFLDAVQPAGIEAMLVV